MKKHKAKTAKSRVVRCVIAVLCVAVAAYIILPFLGTANDVTYNTGRTHEGEKLIALTFDDGPSDSTTELLDVLDQYDAKATFFVLGKKVDKYADVLRRMDADGHLIANHTYDHTSLFRAKQSDFLDGLQATDDALERVIGKRTLFYRPPHGEYLGTMIEHIDKYAILWSYDTIDWKHQDADYVHDRLIEHAKDGAIILMHDTKPTTVQGVARAIAELSEQGYRFVTADELLCRNGDGLRYGLGYRACRDGGRQLYF